MMYRILAEKDNPALREIAHEVSISAIKSSRIQKLIREMKALLSKEKYGVALAAPQVGESLRIFVVSGHALARDPRNSPDELKSSEVRPHCIGSDLKSLPDQVYINPIISKMSRAKKEKHEGCLSIRGKWGIVSRAEKATLRAYDETGRACTRGASGFLAHIFQHEMDHLDGILYTDKASKMYDESKEK